MAGSDQSRKPKIVKQETRIYDNDGSQQYIDFDEGMDITGGRTKPNIQYVERSPDSISDDGSIGTSMRNLMSDDDVYADRTDEHGNKVLLHRGGPAGWAQLVWKHLTNVSANFSEKFVSSDNIYANNFIINYHSYTAPLPFSLEHFVTQCSFTKSKTGAYETARLSLKLPYQLALSLFAEDDAQPQPGGYILIKTRPPTDPDQVLNTQSPENIENALHFGVVSSLQYDVTPDDKGNLICKIDLVANSFIHNLIYGQYRFTFLNSQDEVVREDENGKQVREVREEGYGSREYYKNIDDFLAFVKKEVNAATGKFNLGQSLRNFVEQFAYPMLPVSLHSEPMNTQALYKVLYDPSASFEKTIEQLKLYVPESSINGLLYSLSNLAQLAGEEQIGFGGDPFTQFYDPDNPTRNSFMKYVMNGFTNPDAQYELGYDNDTVSESTRLADAIKIQPRREIQLRDIIHVAVRRDDLPPSSELYGTMPAATETFQDLNRIRNLGAKSLTVWGLMQGTFQVDSQLIEFYPTMIPITHDDIEYFKKNTQIPNPIKHLHKKLGGIPTLILRLKPMHPKVSIDQTSIDAEYKRKKNFGSPSPLPPPCYVTSSELLGLNVKDNSFGKVMTTDTVAFSDFQITYEGEITETLDLSGPRGTFGRTLDQRMGPAQFSRNMSVSGGSSQPARIVQPSAKPIIPVQIRKEQVLSMRFGQNDIDRINATFTNLPGVKNLSSRIKYGIMSDPVINNTAALKHGLRMYESTYPYFELSAYQGQKTNRADDIGQFLSMAQDNYTDMTRFKTTALAERAYMIYGDEQKYFKGTLVCTSLVPQGIYPGCWAEVFMQDPTGDKIDDQHAVLHLYVDSISHDYNVDIITGNVNVKSVISFSRGSYGATMPNFPTVRAAIPDHRSSPGSRTKQSGVTPIRQQQKSIGSKIFEAMLSADSSVSPRRVKNSKEPDLPAGRSHRGQHVTEMKTVKLTKEFLQRLRDNGVITEADFRILKSLNRIPQDNMKELVELLQIAEDIEIEDDIQTAERDDYNFSDLYEQQEANRTSDEAKAGETDKAKQIAKQQAIDARESSSPSTPSDVEENTERVQETTQPKSTNPDGKTPIDPDAEQQRNRQELGTTEEDVRETVRNEGLDSAAGTSVDEPGKTEQLEEIRQAARTRNPNNWNSAVSNEVGHEGAGYTVPAGETDTDGDGLTDREEAIIGTNPNLANTDFDAYTDFEEFVKLEDDTGVGGIETYQRQALPEEDVDSDVVIDEYEREIGMDTTRVDTDGDGIDDYTELRLRTNPLVASKLFTGQEDPAFYENTITWDEYLETYEYPANAREIAANPEDEE